jgi:DNA-binding transcriptional ArsR family regulator
MHSNIAQHINNKLLILIIMDYKNDKKSEILNKLSDSVSGLTITELSNKTGIHRNTVSKYLGILEAEELVNKKDIGAAHLYFSKKRKYLRKNLVNSFIQALLFALKNEFPNNEQIFKDVGLKILDHFEFSLGDAYREEIEKLRGISDTKAYLKLFKEFYNSFDFFQDDIDISIDKLQENKIVYKIKNSEYLDNSDDFIYFFYVMCGITEGIYLRNLNLKVVCNVEDIHISSNKKESFIDVSLEIQK